jgi:pyridoxamine 5'-phosphate oxidase
MNQPVSPFTRFETWFDEAQQLPLNNPQAVVLATADGQGRPAARIVLLKEWDQKGFCFYTNYESRKAQELTANPLATLLFYWDALGKQVRIEGSVEKLATEQSDRYFQSRPLPSQWAARASRQSRYLTSHSELEARFEQVRHQYPHQVPTPDFWGGYRLMPDRFEFWENGDHRLHRRTVFQRQGAVWDSFLLNP